MKRRKKKVKLTKKVFIIILLCIILSVVIFKNKNNIEDIPKDHVILAETPIYALEDNGGISTQQGNLRIYVETNLQINPSGANRNKFGIGETVVFVAQFDKVIKEAKNCKLSFKFGTGIEKTLTGAVSTSNSKNEVVFRYTLVSPDTGELELIALSGSVVDSDGLEVQIGLPQEGKIIISPNTIIADTTIPTIVVANSSIVKEGNILKVTMAISEKMYVKVSDTQISEAIASNIINNLYVSMRDIKGKGNISNVAINNNVITFNYNIVQGDNGIPKAYIRDIFDESANKNTIVVIGTDATKVETTKTPFITEVSQILIEKSVLEKTGTSHRGKEKLYLVEGDSVKITVKYNETIYQSVNYGQFFNSNTALTKDNASGKGINITAGSSSKKAEVIEVADGGKTVTYRYLVANGDNGEFTSIVIPQNVALDNVGHGNESYTANIKNGEALSGNVKIKWPDKQTVEEPTGIKTVVIDALAPTLKSVIPTNTGIFKETSVINCEVEFSEPVIQVSNGAIILYCENSANITENINPSWLTLEAKRALTHSVKSGENGKTIIKIPSGSFKDDAGNIVADVSKSANGNQYADTTKPVITVTPSVESGSNIIKYNFSLSDNSSTWPGGGITPGSFKEDDISIPSTASIYNKGYDANGNLSWIEVLVGMDGMQTLVVKENSFTDVAGNGNLRVETNKMIDRIPPTITSVNTIPSTWTNQKVIVQVEGQDVNGIKEYSFDNGTTWQTSNIKEVTENTTLQVKVKDNADNISSERTVTINNIDKTKPELNAEVQENIINITASDAESGIANCYINDRLVVLSNGTYTYTAEKNGDYTIIVTDNAGNSTTKKVQVTSIDDKGPEITNISINPNTWTNQNVIVTILAEDKSGVKEYSFDNGETWQTSNTIELSKNTILKVKVKDNLENISDVRTVKIDNIDKINPILTAKVEKDKIKIISSDIESGIASCKINDETITLKDREEYVYTAEKNGEYTIIVTDNAGNENTVTVKVTDAKEDMNAPTLEITENKYIKVESDIGVSEEEKDKKYIVLSKEMQISELSKNLKSKDGTVKITKSDYSKKENNNLATGEIVFAETENNEKSIRYTIILKGDVNKDGKVDINDMFQINKCRLGNQTFDKIQKMSADVNEDSMIDINDLFEINKYRLKRITSL